MTDPVERQILPDPRPCVRGDASARGEGPRGCLPADRAAAAAGGRAERARRPARRRRLRRVERVRRAVRRRRPPSGSPASGLKYNRFHTTALCSPTRAGAADRPQPPLGGDGRRSPSSPPRRPATTRSARTPARRWRETLQAERLLDGAVRQVPRGAGLADEPDGPVRRVADRRRRLRALLRLHRRRDEPVLPGDLRGHDAGRARPRRPEEGYHFTEDMTDKAIEWIRQQKSLMPDKPFFIYFAPGRDARAAPRARPSGRTSTRAASTQGWDALREETLARQKELGVDPGRRRADRAARGDPGLGRHARRAEAGARPPDGGLRRLPRAHRPPRRAARRRARRPRRPRRHARLLHHRRQRRLAPRARVNGTFNETVIFNGAAALETPEFMAVADRRVRHARRPTTTTRSAGRTRWTRPTSGPSRSPRTGAAPATARSCTGRTASRRSGEVRSQFHHVIDVAPTVLEAAGLPAADLRQRRRSSMPIEGVEHGATPSTTPTRPTATRRSTSRCSATAASTTRAGPRSPATARRG